MFVIPVAYGIGNSGFDVVVSIGRGQRSECHINSAVLSEGDAPNGLKCQSGYRWKTSGPLSSAPVEGFGG